MSRLHRPALRAGQFRSTRHEEVRGEERRSKEIAISNLRNPRHASPGLPAVSPKRAFQKTVISTKRVERAHGEIPGVVRAPWSLERTPRPVPVIVPVPTALEARLGNTRPSYSLGSHSGMGEPPRL